MQRYKKKLKCGQNCVIVARKYCNFALMQLPEQFIEQIRQLVPDEADAMLQAIGETLPSVSVRVHNHRGARVPDGVVRVPWCREGFYCDERPRFTFDPLWHAGMYYVQDASSMFIHHVISALVHEPVRYLDLCAAPGGKTTAAMQALPQGSLVVANEIVGSRARVLCDNVSRWGNPSCVVTSSAPRDLGKLTHFFDVIAADVPCSGEGMMRKDDEAVTQWTPALVEQCAQRQRGIIDDVWQALKPGGLFIYSTCTYNREENELMLDYIIDTYGAQSVPVDIEAEWNIHAGVGTQLPCYRFLPHLTRGEGLFMAVLRKPADEPLRPVKPSKKQRTPSRTDAPRAIKQWLTDDKDFTVTISNDIVTAVPRQHSQAIDLLHTAVNVLQGGVEMGMMKGKNCVPTQSLALSLSLSPEAFPRVELDYVTAIAYLRGEAITVEAPRGYVAVTYCGAVMGFVNNLGNRANNMYPKALRILSSHLPDTAPKVLL